MSKDNKTILIKSEDIENYEIDEAANDYPMLTKEEHNRLVEDIKINGQLQPVVIFKNKIVDGRNRAKAVKELGKFLKGIVVTTTYEDALNLAYSNNDKRRHMSKSQFAMKAAYKVVASRKDSEGKPLPKTEWLEVQKAQEVLDKIVGSRNVTTAVKIALNNEVLAKEVFDGKKELANAIRELDESMTPVDTNVDYFKDKKDALVSYNSYVAKGAFSKQALAKKLVELELEMQELKKGI